MLGCQKIGATNNHSVTTCAATLEHPTSKCVYSTLLLAMPPHAPYITCMPRPARTPRLCQHASVLARRCSAHSLSCASGARGRQIVEAYASTSIQLKIDLLPQGKCRNADDTSQASSIKSPGCNCPWLVPYSAWLARPYGCSVTRRQCFVFYA